MSLEDPVVITCSISGVIANREQCPAIPYTPEEYARRGRRAVEEGASMIHIHARKPDGTPSYEIEDFRRSPRRSGARSDDVIVNYSTGTVGVPVAKRVEYLRACRPEVAALNMGSMNYAKYSRTRKDFVFKMVFQNPFDEIIELLEAMNELGIKPEHECFDVGHVGSLEPLVDMGVLKAPLHVDCVMGVVGGIPPTPRNLAAMVDNIGESWGRHVKHHWGVIGISPRPVDADRHRADARRLDPRRRRGQPVPAQRRDGALQRRSDRPGAAHDRRRRPRARYGRRGARAAGDRLMGVRSMPSMSVMSLPLRASGCSTSRVCCPAASARCCWPTSAPRC